MPPWGVAVPPCGVAVPGWGAVAPGVVDVAPGVVDPVPVCGVDVMPGLAAVKPAPVEPAPAPVCGIIRAATSYVPRTAAVGPGFEPLLVPQWSAIFVTLLTWNELLAAAWEPVAPAPLPMLPAFPVCVLDAPDAEGFEFPMDDPPVALAEAEAPPLPIACPVSSTCCPTWVRS